MSVKEIRELEDEVREISVDDSDGDSGEFEEKDVVSEASDEVEYKDKEKDFSIGDTMLARGSAKDVWGGTSLEEELEGEEFDRAFDDDVFEEEEEGAESFSYETMSDKSEGGDLYGASGVGGDLYGVGGSSGNSSDLYNAGKSDSVSMYNVGGGATGGEGDLYNVGGPKRRGGMGVSYKVEGPKKKKVRRNTEGSGLERGLNMPKKRRRSKGVSLV